MIEFYQDAAGEHRWRAISGNGRIVGAASEGFHDRAEAQANARRLLSMMAAWMVGKPSLDPDLHTLSISTLFGDIELEFRVPRRVREAWEEIRGAALMKRLAEQLARFEPGAPSPVNDDSTTNPIEIEP